MLAHNALRLENRLPPARPENRDAPPRKEARKEPDKERLEQSPYPHALRRIWAISAARRRENFPIRRETTAQTLAYSLQTLCPKKWLGPCTRRVWRSFGGFV